MIRNKSTEQGPREQRKRGLPLRSGVDRSLEQDPHCKLNALQDDIWDNSANDQRNLRLVKLICGLDIHVEKTIRFTAKLIKLEQWLAWLLQTTSPACAERIAHVSIPSHKAHAFIVHL